MKYQTTRNQEKTYTFTEMMRLNVPETGGFFVPETMPLLSQNFIHSLKPLNFLERAKKILAVFADDLTENQISDICETAWRQAYETDILPESKQLNPYIENPIFIFMMRGETGTYLDFIHAFLLSIIRHLALENETWLLLSDEKNAGIKALLNLQFDVEKFVPLLLVNSRNTNNFTLREMQYIWLCNRYREEFPETLSVCESTSKEAEKSFCEDSLALGVNTREILSDTVADAVVSTQNPVSDKLDFSDEFIDSHQLQVFRVKADIREFEKMSENIFQNTDLREKLATENKFLYHMGSLNFAYYIALIILMISAYLDFIEAEQLEEDKDFILAFPNNNLDFLYVGILLKELGLPISDLCVTTNQNNSIIDFLQKGLLKQNRKFFKTNAEGLDQIYYPNLERFIFELVARDTQKTKQALAELANNKNDTLKNILKDFKKVIEMASIPNKQATKQIADWYLRTDYLFDPYTALVLEHITRNRHIQFDAKKIMIPVIAHPLLFSQVSAESIFTKKQTKRKPYHYLLDMISSESGLDIPVSACSDKAAPEVIYVDIKDLADTLEAFLLPESASDKA